MQAAHCALFTVLHFLIGVCDFFSNDALRCSATLLLSLGWPARVSSPVALRGEHSVLTPFPQCSARARGRRLMQKFTCFVSHSAAAVRRLHRLDHVSLYIPASRPRAPVVGVDVADWCRGGRGPGSVAGAQDSGHGIVGLSLDSISWDGSGAQECDEFLEDFAHSCHAVANGFKLV